MRRRFFIFFGLIGAAVATLVAKLWSMQVMSGEEYTQRAGVQPHHRVHHRGARASSTATASSWLATAPRLSCSPMPRCRTTPRSSTGSTVLGIPRETIRQSAASQSGGAQADRVLAIDIDSRAVAYITEHHEAFPASRSRAARCALPQRQARVACPGLRERFQKPS